MNKTALSIIIHVPLWTYAQICLSMYQEREIALSHSRLYFILVDNVQVFSKMNVKMFLFSSMGRAAHLASIRHMSRQVRAAPLASIRQMSRQVSRGSAGEYQADEQAGVAGVSWRL